ncbi:MULTISPECIES: hypothetical protein [unclassified Colwellia]|nr:MULTISPECIES: hypothetical protein [unclassified Colwellia]
MGKAPPAAHIHIFVSKELFDLRKQLLNEPFEEARAEPKLVV